MEEMRFVASFSAPLLLLMRSKAATCWRETTMAEETDTKKKSIVTTSRECWKRKSNISLFSLCGNENIARAQETKGQMKKKSQMNGGGTSADGNEAGRWEVNASVLLSCHASLAPGVRRPTIGLFHPPEKSCQRFHRYVSYISLKLMFRVPLYRQRGPSGHIFWRLLSTATTIGPNLV